MFEKFSFSSVDNQVKNQHQFDDKVRVAKENRIQEEKDRVMNVINGIKESKGDIGALFGIQKDEDIIDKSNDNGQGEYDKYVNNLSARVSIYDFDD